ncbi:MAG: glycine--tRNA ligase [Candidatus Bathyarchaeota archaeon]|nr:glycine--tRNA ligase [Candidatus Bathyarchaeota archaeon]
MSEKSRFDRIGELAIRRGFYFPAAEIYPDASAGFWDYGPLGSALKRRIIDVWRQMIVKRDGMLEIDGAQILPESVFEASGHLESFADPLTECKECKRILRADRLIQDKTGKLIPEALSTRELENLIHVHDVTCPECGGELSEVAKFNLMFRFAAGPRMDSRVALRPETCQSIFLDFPRLYRTMRAKLPVGIAQVGRSFRNEISPRQGLIRLRELIQAEIEVFFNPKRVDGFEKFDEVAGKRLSFLLLSASEEQTLTAREAVDKKIVQNKLVAYYLVLLAEFYEKLGISPENIRFRELPDEEKPFYAESAWDLEIKTSFGWLETVANHYRTDHDLKVHSKGSKTDLSVIDGEEKVLPWVWEDSMGIDRTLLVVLDAAYTEEGKRRFLRLPNYLAPIEVAVFPLVDRDGLTEKAKKIYDLLRSQFDAVFDEKDSIGRRYFRMDEIGVPFAVTIDYDTLKDDTVTIRERDSRKQIRIGTSEMEGWLKQRFHIGYSG